jgi:hypothetical protein
MDAKKIFIVTVLAFSVGLQGLHAAMPFGRLMPLHYGPDDIRTVVVPRIESTPLFASSQTDDLLRAGHRQDRQGN